MNKLLLLGTDACHLCEQAEIILKQSALSFELVDIAEQEQWQEKYALRIPVLYAQEHAILCWPFNVSDVQVFVASLTKQPKVL